MARPRRRARRQASKRLAPFYRMTFIILMGAVAARLIILGIDALGARTGLPGGELFIPLYIIIAPVFGWQLRGWTAIGSHQRRKETTMNNNITGTIVQLNEYPPDKFNVLIPVTTMQVMSNLQRIIVNKVQLDVADPENSKDIYREKSSGKYAITKVGGMKLAAAANISIVETESGMTDGCKRCVDMARAVGKPKACGTCPARYDVAVTVTIRVPEPSGGFRLMKATKEIDCAAEKESMTEAQYKRFLPHRTAMAESKAFMRALRAALGLAATYSLPELRKPFIIAHVVPNLDAPEIKEAVASNYLQSMGMLFEGAGAPRAALPAAQTTAEVIPDDGADGGYEAGGMPEEPDDAPDFDDPDAIFCDDCGEQIVETRAKDGRIWTPENIKGYSERKFGRCLCTRCQKAEKAARGGR